MSSSTSGKDLDDSPAEKAEQHEGYTLRDLRRLVRAMLPRYGRLLSREERAALCSFEQLSLRSQQLYARLLSRKWPQWVSLDGLGARYRELGEEEARQAAAELAAPPLAEAGGLTRQRAAQECEGAELGGSARGAESLQAILERLEEDNAAASATREESPLAPWLLDTATETAATLLRRPLDERASPAKENYGTLLLGALPAPELRRLGRGLGVADVGSGSGRRGAKSRLLARLCDAARQQHVLQLGPKPGRTACTTEARLIEQALRCGRWVCAAPTPGRSALAALGELFRLETSGVADSSYVVFSTRWPEFGFQPENAAPPLFMTRSALDTFLAARSLVAGLEGLQEHERPSLERASTEAATAEAELRKALVAVGHDGFEAAKFRDPFRRRFTAAWCYAEALHHAVMSSPAVGDDESLRATKVRQLRLLLSCRLCTSRRGRWYAELAKEVSRSEGAAAALEVAAEGLAEGEAAPVTARVAVDLTCELASSQEAADTESPEMSFGELPMLARDARWDLARRCRALANRAAGGCRGRGGRASCAWQKLLRDTKAARQKAEGGDDGGRWLPRLVLRLIEEEEKAAGAVRSVSAATLGLPQVGPAPEASGGKVTGGRRRMFDGFHLEELTVEELALQFYFSKEGGNFCCGIHCEGSLLRDLFGILLFHQLFNGSVPGAFASAFQDAPLDLGTEAFYPCRAASLENRLRELASMSGSTLAQEVRSCFAALHGTRIRGVRWERYEGPSGVFVHGASHASVSTASTEDDATKACASGDTDEQSTRPDSTASQMGRRVLWTQRSTVKEVPPTDRDLGAAAGAIGGRAVATALRLLCEDYNSAGLPDLLLWSWQGGSAPRARFSEVKSERDSLSRRQRLWLTTLRNAGVEAEVCHLRDGPVQEGSTGKRSAGGAQRGVARRQRGSEGSSEGF
eukprot:TRINITY_DN34094_c0_g2_i1.p1 TRINITY_DN34094_c0_g2~~TRINITY_DN34094_c0_g2_i1.p1  ORF type:complete len:1016 (-),score=202.13 TRINITY_DN34094_c0_g2_i1:10-2781(-)